jgi:hypothetical protein
LGYGYAGYCIFMLNCAYWPNEGNYLAGKQLQGSEGFSP